MTTKLYELTEAMQRVLQLIDEGDEGWSETLSNLEDAFEHKAESVAKMIRMFEASSAARKAESDRLAKGATADSNAAQRLTDYLQHNMEAMEIESLTAGLFKLRIQDTPPRVEVPDWKDVPVGYLTSQIVLPYEKARELGLAEDAGVPTIDRRAILEKHKLGETVQGTEVKRGRKLYIR